MRPCAEFAIGRLLDARIEPRCRLPASYWCDRRSWSWSRSRLRWPGLCRRSCPSRIAARLAQFVFEIGDVRFVLRDGRRLFVNLRFCIVQVLAGIFLLQRRHRVGVILLLLQVEFALQDVQFVRIVREFLVRVGEFLPPVGFILDRRFLSGAGGLLRFVVRGRFLGLVLGRSRLLRPRR